jgi:hypothetical protein
MGLQAVDNSDDDRGQRTRAEADHSEPEISGSGVASDQVNVIAFTVWRHNHSLLKQGLMSEIGSRDGSLRSVGVGLPWPREAPVQVPGGLIKML